MFQVCFTACLAEEGKESRKEYSIYYYARANARASVPCRKSVQKQESRRFSISGKGRKRGKSAGMAGKNTAGACTKPAEKRHSGSPQIPELLKNSPPKKAAGRKIHSEKCEFSFRKVLRKVEKLWIRREKFSTLHGKKLENDSKGEGKMPGNGKRKPKKTGFSFEKNSGKALKTREWDEKISQHWTKKISR